ncbi:MAG: hypothetical protein MHPSP_003764, partial [Paramarteilia canceri]
KPAVCVFIKYSVMRQMTTGPKGDFHIRSSLRKFLGPRYKFSATQCKILLSPEEFLNTVL